MAERVRMFTPEHTRCPLALFKLTGQRWTVAIKADGTVERLGDNWRIAANPRRHLDGHWVGRTELEVDVNLLSPEERNEARRQVQLFRQEELIDGL